MKGFLVSLIALVLYGVSTMIVARTLRPRRHVYLFPLMAAVWCGGYFFFYALTPPDLWFLPGSWMCGNTRFDAGYGLVIFLLNVHTAVDCFYACSSGFSIALLVATLKNGNAPTTTDDLVSKFKRPGETDRVYGWRVPHLVNRGYVHHDPRSDCYSLAAKGRFLAIITGHLKRLMNLAEGG